MVEANPKTVYLEIQNLNFVPKHVVDTVVELIAFL